MFLLAVRQNAYYLRLLLLGLILLLSPRFFHAQENTESYSGGLYLTDTKIPFKKSEKQIGYARLLIDSTNAALALPNLQIIEFI